MKVGKKRIGQDQRCFLIAEVAQAHDGSLGMAHAYVDAAADGGADAVKFQTHIAEAESTRDEKFRVKPGPQDRSRYEYWERMEFSPEQWKGLKKHAIERGLIFLSSPFSEAAVDLLEGLNLPAWKIGSGEMASGMLLDYILKRTKGPVLLSTGMCRWREIDKAVRKVQKAKRPLAIFHCVSEYPTPLQRSGLNLLQKYQCKYRVPVGLSDHSGPIYPALAAIAKGVSLLEMHLILDRKMRGPDATSSLTIEEFRIVREFADAWLTFQKNTTEKDSLTNNMNTMRKRFGKSLALREYCPAGTILTSEMLCYKKPGSGIPPQRSRDLLGKILIKPKNPDELLRWRDLK